MRRHDDEPDLFAGLAAKEEALERVLAHSGLWKDQAMDALLRVPVGFVGTGEEIGRAMCAGGLGQPPHHNAWGGLINRAIKAELLEDLGKHRPMAKPSSHARRTPVYRRI